MASTLVMNIMSHIGVVAYSNFTPIATVWESFYKLSSGAHKFMQIIRNVTVLYDNPINLSLKWRLFNQYFYSGIVPITNRDKIHSRVKEDAIDDTNRSNI